MNPLVEFLDGTHGNSRNYLAQHAKSATLLQEIENTFADTLALPALATHCPILFGGDPISWTPDDVGRSPRWQSENDIQQSCSSRWCGSFEPVEHRKSCPESFEPSAQAIRTRIKQAELDEGTRSDGLKTEEREELSPLLRENAQLKEARDPVKSRGLVRAGDREDVEKILFFVSAHQAMFSIRAMWMLVRSRENENLQRRIEAIYRRSRQTYGARIHAELRDEGTPVGRKRVARLMKKSGLAGVSR